MISRLFEERKVNELSVDYVKNANLDNQSNFETGVNTADKLFINTFYKACDNLDIPYRTQQAILDNMTIYLNR